MQKALCASCPHKTCCLHPSPCTKALHVDWRSLQKILFSDYPVEDEDLACRIRAPPQNLTHFHLQAFKMTFYFQVLVLGHHEPLYIVFTGYSKPGWFLIYCICYLFPGHLKNRVHRIYWSFKTLVQPFKSFIKLTLLFSYFRGDHSHKK